MKWHNDPYKKLKLKLFDLLMEELVYENLNVSIRTLSNSIDEMIEKFIREKRNDN